MSTAQRKQRSSLSSLQQQKKKNQSGIPRSSARQTKVASQGFSFGDARQGERDLERAEKELVRDQRRKEQRLEELERGSGPSSSWNDSNSFNIPAASTSAAAIAGLLAGRQAAEQEESFDDLSSSKTTSTTSAATKRKQSSELKRLLVQRRSLKLLLEDASASPVFKDAPNSFLQSLQVSNPYPTHRSTGPVCSICGYWGDIRCIRCQERICSLKCGATHDETRCERPL